MEVFIFTTIIACFGMCYFYVRLTACRNEIERLLQKEITRLYEEQKK